MNKCKQCGKETLNDEFCNNCNTEVPLLDDNGLRILEFTSFPTINTELDDSDMNTWQSTDKDSLSYVICAFVYPVILIIIGLIMFASNNTNVIGMIFNIAFAIATGFAFAKSGFSFYIIPLPVIYLYGWKFCKENSGVQRTLYIILLIIFVICSIAIPTAFK